MSDFRRAVAVELGASSAGKVFRGSRYPFVTRGFDVIVFVLTCACALSGVASDAAAELANFPASKFPFSPSLTVNRNPELCGIALADARMRFMGSQPDTKVARVDRYGFAWLDWQAAPLSGQSHESISRLDLDLDATGQSQTLVYRVVLHSWRGENHYAYVVPSPAAYEQLIANPDRVGEMLSEITARRPGQSSSVGIFPYYPEAQLFGSVDEDPVETGSDWQPHKLFRWKSKYYFYDEGNSWARMRDSHLSIYRLRSDGAVELHCEIQMLPDKKLIADFRKLPGIASFLKSLNSIGAAGNGNCGTLNANRRHDLAAYAATDRAAYRPWSVSRSSGSYFVYNERMLEFIKDWRFGDIWNRREAQTFAQHIAPARKALERYFVGEFGLTRQEAAEQANGVLEDLIGAWIQIPGAYIPEVDRYNLEYSTLTEALMTREADALEALIVRFKAKDAEFAYEWRSLSDFLPNAVEWPHGLEALLAAGADPNHSQFLETGRGFGKTPLMMAAHMNRPDSVRLLLEHGADPSLRTNKSAHTCHITIDRGSRSALMYALENAGPDVMKLLLDAGADATAVDSKGNGMSFYLERNPRFGVEDKRMGILELVRLKQPLARGPGFNCAEARTRLEKKICSDEILRIMDKEMTDAYVRWRRVEGREAKADQRSWLRKRGKGCVAGDGQKNIGCLQDETRARVRYIHNRLEESL